MHIHIVSFPARVARVCRYAVSAAVVMLALQVMPAAAADKHDKLIVGVINQQTIIEKSKSGQKAMEELKSYSSARQKIIASDETELREMEKVVQDSSLKEDVRQEKEVQLRARFEAYQRRIQDFNREIQQKQREMVEEYSRRIGLAAQAVAQKRGYTAVMDEGAEGNMRVVVYHHSSVDMTDEVIKEFDKQAPAQ
ncbi:MAG: OmpH family outer membrane protein [Nitrospiraceae bacterium]